MKIRRQRLKKVLFFTNYLSTKMKKFFNSTKNFYVNSCISTYYQSNKIFTFTCFFFDFFESDNGAKYKQLVINTLPIGKFHQTIYNRGYRALPGQRIEKRRAISLLQRDAHRQMAVGTSEPARQHAYQKSLRYKKQMCNAGM